MKQKNIKNHIAFTLTEMTLVLLIMSVLAAVLTPAITKTISNNAKSLPANVVVSPWKNITTGYPYNGMYNLGGFNYSMVSIGYKPLSTHTSYRSPALLLRARNGATKTSIMNAPQISILPTGTNNSSNNLNIGIDNNANIGVLIDSTVSARSVNSIFMGSSINVGGTNNYAVNSIYLGSIINQQYGSLDSIYIGSNITTNRYDSNNIVIAARTQFDDSGDPQKDSVLIGYKVANRSNSQCDVKIGYNAGSNLKKTYGTVMIGTYAGRVTFSDTENRTGYVNQSTFIGYNAGAVTMKTTYNSYKDVSIGQYAGYLSGDDIYSSENVNIGAYSGSGMCNRYGNVNIGAYAGVSGFNVENSVSIGQYAGYYGYSKNGAVMLGYGVGASTCHNSNSIYIGAWLSTRWNKTYRIPQNELLGNSIVIGFSRIPNLDNLAFLNAFKRGSILIGSSKAGYSDSNLGTNLIGLGYNACRQVSGENKICIGSNASEMSYTAGGWNPTSNDSQTIIGNSVNMSSNYITLYAGTIYSNASITVPSDRRLKENVVPSKHSLNDIRKVNIYNYNMKGDKEKTPHIGVIAQEHKKIFPHAVSKHPTFKHYTVSAEWVNFTAVNAVKEIDKNVQQLQKNVKQFIKDFLGLKSHVQKLEIKLAKLQKENKEIKAHLNKINAKLN